MDAEARRLRNDPEEKERLKREKQLKIQNIRDTKAAEK